MTAYRRGTDREKRTAASLRKDGYFVVESRGSHGCADLVAVKPGQVLMVQVKTGDARLEHWWWNELLAEALRAGALPIVADWPRRGRLRLRQITRPHEARSKFWPCAPFMTDLVGAETRRGDDR